MIKIVFCVDQLRLKHLYCPLISNYYFKFWNSVLSSFSIRVHNDITGDITFNPNCFLDYNQLMDDVTIKDTWLVTTFNINLMSYTNDGNWVCEPIWLPVRNSLWTSQWSSNFNISEIE